MFKKIISILFLGILCITFSGLTYAGFYAFESSYSNSVSASTLYFEITDQSNTKIFTPLFYFSDLRPGEEKSSSFKILKKGTEDFKYNLFSVKKGGDEILCNKIQIDARIEGVSAYKGDLVKLWAMPTPLISGGEDNWEFVLSLTDSSEDLMDKTCTFDLMFKAWQINSDGNWGFTDFYSISNTVSTTTWEMPILQTEEIQENNSSEIIEKELTPTPTADPSIVPTEAPISPTPTLGPIVEGTQLPE